MDEGEVSSLCPLCVELRKGARFEDAPSLYAYLVRVRAVDVHVAVRVVVARRAAVLAHLRVAELVVVAVVARARRVAAVGPVVAVGAGAVAVVAKAVVAAVVGAVEHAELPKVVFHREVKRGVVARFFFPRRAPPPVHQQRPVRVAVDGGVP